MTELVDPAVGVSRRAFSRGALLAGLGIGFAPVLASCADNAAPSHAGKKTRVIVSLTWVSNVEFAGYWIADSKGYYAEEGLEVLFKPGGPNAPDPTALVSAGTADIAVQGTMQTLLQAIDKGNDFVIIGTDYQTSPSGLMSLSSKPVTSVDDLPGLRILGAQGTQPFLDAVYKVNGLEPDYTFVPVGFDPGPLVKKQGDAFVCYVTNQPTILEDTFKMKQGTDYEVVTFGELNYPQYADLVFCRRAYLDDNHDAVVRFMRATVRGWQDNLKDPSLAAGLVVSKYGADLGLSKVQQARSNELQIPLTKSALTDSHGMMRVDSDLLAGGMYDALKAAGVTSLPDAGRVVDQSVLDAVFGAKATI